jgi:hypothetical protein
MTPERFRQLIEAYGAAPRQWPEAERREAEAFLASGDPAVLSDARELDLFLAAHEVAPAEPDLVRRIVMSAPHRRASRRWWLSGVGLVGAGAAGVAAGVLALTLTAPLSPPPAHADGSSVFDQTDAGTAFGSGPHSDWSEQ